MAPRLTRRNMEQVRGLKDIIHSDGVHKAGHIFKVPDDVDLETARRWVKKGIATDTIEVLDEPVEADEAEAELSSAIDAESDAALDAAADKEPDDEGSEDEPDEGEDPEETTDVGGDLDQGEEAVAIEDMNPNQLKEELDARKIKYHFGTGEKKLRAKLADALKAEAEAENDTDEPSDSDGGDEE